MDGTERLSLRQLKKMFKKTLYSHRTPVSKIREEYDNFFYFPHIPNNADINSSIICSIPVDIIQPEMAAAHRAVLYAHGGSFISGSRKAARNLCVSLAHECNTNLFLPEYRLAPEYPFPAGLEDLYVVYEGICKEYKLAPHEIIFAGDGAGCALATALVHKLKKQNKHLPSALMLISPWVDLTCSNPEIAVLRKQDTFLTKDALIAAAGRYTFQDRLTYPLVSPLYGDFSHFPPVFIQCGEHEILAADARALAHAITTAGGVAELDIWENMWHLFQAMEIQSEEAHRAVEKIGKWIQRHFAAADK